MFKNKTRIKIIISVCLSSIVLLLIWFIFNTIIPAVNKYYEGQKIVNQIDLLENEKKEILAKNKIIDIEYNKCSNYQQEAIVLLDGNKSKIESLDSEREKLKLEYSNIVGMYSGITVNAINPVRDYKYIVIHHTGTPVMSIEKEMESNKRKFGVYPYHYYIGVSGDVVKAREVEDVVGATRNMEANINGIQIALVGNFNEIKPTTEQYNALNVLIKQVREKYGSGLDVKSHKDFAKTSCPGTNFDFGMIGKFIHTKTNNGWTMTRYYSPEKGQSKYYGGKTYEQDVTMNCGASAIGNDGCSYPANGQRLINNVAGKVVACSQDYPLGTKFEIKNYGRVTCVDRGGAITGNKLDLRMGYGEEALDRILKEKRPAGKIEILNIIKK